METSLEVFFTPADFEGLKTRDLCGAFCVVFDVLRATSSMVAALANGAESIVPVEEIEEALRMRAEQRHVLLAGERDGVRISRELTGSVDFDLANSPREFTSERVSGKTIVMTTTNGTRALKACSRAKNTLICSFLNLGATVQFIRRQRPAHLLVICGGTYSQAAYEDVLGAGALCDRLWAEYQGGAIADSALIARQLFRLGQAGLFSAVAESRNGRRLLSRPELAEDVRFSVQADRFPLVAGLRNGEVRRLE